MSFGEFIPTPNSKLVLHLNGNSNDSSGNGNNGTDTGITYGKQYGKFNEGVSMAQTSKISIPHQSYFNLQSDFTILAWVYPTSRGTSLMYSNIIVEKDKYPSTGRSFSFYIRGIADSTNVGKLYFSYNVPLDLYVKSNETIPLYEWSLVGIVKNSSGYTFYRNAKNIGSGNTNITPVQLGTNPLTIGSHGVQTYTGSFIGNIDDVIIENRAWSPVEIQKYFTNSKGWF